MNNFEQLTLLPEDGLVSRIRRQRVGVTFTRICGQNSYASSSNVCRDGLSGKTCRERIILSRPQLICETYNTPYGKYVSAYLFAGTFAIERILWPTPTATANHLSPSMAKWPAYARMQWNIRKITPRLWEWMMGFPAGWTDLEPSATPSSPR